MKKIIPKVPNKDTDFTKYRKGKKTYRSWPMSKRFSKKYLSGNLRVLYRIPQNGKSKTLFDGDGNLIPIKDRRRK